MKRACLGVLDWLICTMCMDNLMYGAGGIADILGYEFSFSVKIMSWTGRKINLCDL